jgi:hypothetical protein
MAMAARPIDKWPDNGPGFRVTEHVTVPFAGEGADEGPLTWGQHHIWRIIQQQRCSLGVGDTAPLPEGTTLEALIAGFTFLLSRHQSLRTRVGFDADGNPVQVVAARGEVPLQIIDVDDDADPIAVGAELRKRYHDVEFDYTGEWPVRLAAMRHRGVFTHAVALYCHLATDGGGMEAMLADLANLDFVTGRATMPATERQPRAQAAWQRSPAGLRQSRSAIRRWEQAVRSIPSRRFRESTDFDEPRFRYVYFNSPSTHLAAQMVAARTGTNTSPVLLASFALTMARLTGYNPVAMQVIASNRFRPGMVDYVGTISQNGICVIDLADITFHEAVDRARRGSMSAYRTAYFNPVELDELLARIGAERGEEIDLECVFNDRRTEAQRLVADKLATPEQVQEARPRTTIRWAQQLERTGERFFFHINDMPDTVDIWMCIDGRALSHDDTEALLFGFEATTIEAAFDPDYVTGF